MPETTNTLRLQVSTADAPPPSWAYSQGIVANGFLFTAGQTPHDPVTDETVGISIEEQTTRTMQNLAAVLAAHGLDFSHVVKASVHLHHPGRDAAGFNAIYEQFMVKPYPARTTVGSFLGDFLVEIDVVAVVPPVEPAS
ncbi:Rid family hydrolase [Paeniglutamicibacter kerguelensis]|uniref:2-iminobutanoate/2-iminopropanoate deaminase n=1 Tax=Paeniglutamicibacter kerguelensis TaxID=254788 RepID=A0ABS4XIK7_9MICC|nr:Rid family hydrolase [Paeniglutamicibacter kerguelensis]MBP2387504.1 2-iminobutanoate/2-iminopropanoate deaminase [Paeniglutamicibacter kerguelensis]